MTHACWCLPEIEHGRHLLHTTLRGSIASLALRPVCRTVYASACSLPLTTQDSFPGGWLGLAGEGIPPSEWIRLRLGTVKTFGLSFLKALARATASPPRS